MVVVVVAGCGDAGPSAPVILGLTATPTMLTAGQRVTLSGDLDFKDANGDVGQAVFDLLDPAGKSTGMMTTTTGTERQLVARVPYMATITPTTAGAWQFCAHVVDAGGLSSDVACVALDVR